MELSADERKRRSELAKSLHSKGKFGGKQDGAGRPKKMRASEVVAEGIREDGDKILKALRAALSSDSASTKLKAALSMLEIERKEAELKMKEEQREYDAMSKDKLLELAQERIRLLQEQGIDIGEIIAGRASEVGSGGTEVFPSDARRSLPPGS